jgi:putative hydrolase of the HAD superfamily
MKQKPSHILTDLGGVLLTNGWDREVRRRVAEQFHVDATAMDERHHLTYDTYESGKCDVWTYLDRIIFYELRAYTPQQVLDFILDQARPLSETIGLVQELKARHGLKVGVVSNEGRELGEDRVRRFALAEFIDFFVISGCVGLRKPDTAIFRLALDLAQAQPDQVAYLEDRRMFVDVGASVGLRAVWHRDAAQTRAALAAMGLD